MEEPPFYDSIEGYMNECKICKGKRFVMKAIGDGTLKRIPCPECNKEEK